MITPTQCLKRFGQPGTLAEGAYMARVALPDDVLAAFKHVQSMPSAPYCHKLMGDPLIEALRNVIAAGLAKELIEWGGVYNFRKQRGGNALSLHSWGLAVDLNPDQNPMGRPPKFTPAFVECFKRAGFDWGGEFRGARVDGMHFQLASLD